MGFLLTLVISLWLMCYIMLHYLETLVPWVNGVYSGVSFFISMSDTKKSMNHFSWRSIGHTRRTPQWKLLLVNVIRSQRSHENPLKQQTEYSLAASQLFTTQVQVRRKQEEHRRHICFSTKEDYAAKKQNKNFHLMKTTFQQHASPQVDRHIFYLNWR